MDTQKTVFWSIIAIFIISVATIGGIVYAYRGDGSLSRPNYDVQVHEQLEAAIESGDYELWMQIRKDNNLPTTGRMFQVITKENFDTYAKLHAANIAGDTATADALRAELGLGQGRMQGSGTRPCSGMHAQVGSTLSQGCMHDSSTSCPMQSVAAGTTGHTCGRMRN